LSALPVPLPLPDAERIVVEYLRASTTLAPLLDDRAYTAFPAQAGPAPLIVVQRVGGEPELSQPLVLDSPQLQVDVYGGTKAQAHELAAATRAELSALIGVQPHGVVTGVRFASLRYLPDETYKPARPRYLFDVLVHVRASAVTGAASRRRSLVDASRSTSERGT
jgi:hypothetical protein